MPKEITEAPSPNHSRDELLKELKRIVKIQNKQYFQKKEFNRLAEGFNSREVVLSFGSWNRALRESGVTKFPKKKDKTRKNEKKASLKTSLIHEIKEAMKLEDFKPTKKFWASQNRKYRSDVYMEKFGSWERAIEIAKNSFKNKELEEKTIDPETDKIE